MKAKQTNKYGEKKEKKERIDTKLNRGRSRKFIYVKDQLQWENNSRKGKQRNKCGKNNKF